MATKWVSFDCYGTLVDWHGGFSTILRTVAGNRTAELLRAYHQFEPHLEAQRPHRNYKDVLTASLLLAAREIVLELSESQARSLPQQWNSMPVFGDVEEALDSLRADGCKLGVLTNCDEDLFAQTQRSFRQPFDLVVTAEQIQDYKPSPSHFRHFQAVTGTAQGDWVHVACSWFHDIAPARDLGIQRIWLDRDNTGEDPRAATCRITSATALAETVRKLIQSGQPGAASAGCIR